MKIGVSVSSLREVDEFISIRQQPCSTNNKLMSQIPIHHSRKILKVPALSLSAVDNPISQFRSLVEFANSKLHWLCSLRDARRQG